MPDIWDDFTDSYPSGDVRTAMGKLFDYLRDPVTASPPGKEVGFEEFLNMTTAEISDLIVDFKTDRPTDANSFHKTYIKQFILTANGLKDGNCLTKGQLDNEFFNATRDESRSGILDLLITLKEDTPGAEVSINDITCESGSVDTKAQEVTNVILLLPCSHGYVASQSNALITDSSNFVSSVTNIFNIQLQLSADGGYLENYRIEWYENTSEEPVIVSSSLSSPQGYLDIPYSTVTNLPQSYSSPTIRIFDGEGRPVKFKTSPSGSEITELALAFPPTSTEIDTLKALVFIPNPETYTPGEDTFDSAMYTFMGFEASPDPSALRDYLEDKNIYEVFIAIRAAGGVEFLIGETLTGGDVNNAKTLNKFANLDLVSPNRYFNKYLIIEEEFDHFLDIIGKTRTEFVAIAESVPNNATYGAGRIRQYNATEIYENTITVSTYLNNYIVERRKEYANAN